MAEFKDKVYVVDSIMGSGKTEAIISYIKQHPEKKFVVIVPYLEEIKRYQDECAPRILYDPYVTFSNGKMNSKFKKIKELFREHRDIISTHALFTKFDRDIMDMVKALGYTLVLDEVADVMSQYDFNSDVFDLMLDTNTVEVDQKTGRVSWIGKNKPRTEAFEEFKGMCDFNSMVYYEPYKTLFWMYPAEIFNAFRTVFVLTYMFDAQIMGYYMKYNGIEYTRIGVEESDGKYVLSKTVDLKPKYAACGLIHICEKNKLNAIGDDNYALSKSWYDERDRDNEEINALRCHMHNYFQNVTRARSDKCLWGSFTESRDMLTYRGYSKGFLAMNFRAINEYGDRTVVAYMVNRFMNPVTKNFFKQHGIEVDEEGYALAEMLQFIWRSAIRNGQEIDLYIPSKRMRTLLKEWIAENTVQEVAAGEN